MKFIPVFLFVAGLSGSVALQGCSGLGGPAFFDGAAPDETGWVGFPMGEFLTRPSVTTELLAACFDRSCPEPAVLLILRAKGADAAELRATIRNPASLADALNARAKRGTPAGKKAIRTQTTTASATIGGKPGFMISMKRVDDPSRDVHGVVVSSSGKNDLTAIISIGRRADVALANAESAAQDSLN